MNRATTPKTTVPYKHDYISTSPILLIGTISSETTHLRGVVEEGVPLAVSHGECLDSRHVDGSGIVSAVCTGKDTVFIVPRPPSGTGP